MIEQLSAVNDRIGRAEQHLDTLKAGFLSYYDADGCFITGEYKPDPNGRRGTVEEVEITIPEIDAHLNTLVGEVLHNLHSALEHLGWQLVSHAGGEPTEQTYFPICHVAPATNKKGQQVGPGIAGGISDAARTLIDAVQPYKWGDDYTSHPLWVLHRLWNIDKHRHVIARGTHTTVVFRGLNVPRFRFTSQLHSTGEHGATLNLVPDDPTMKVDAYTTVRVAIHEPDERIEKPLVETLEEAHEALRKIASEAEATCF